MKTIILLVGVFVLHQISYAQCDKPITFKCNKARNLKSGNVGQELPIDATIEFKQDKMFLTATMNGQTETVEGKINEISICDWKDYLINGRSQFKALTKKGNANAEYSTIEIKSDNGYTTVSFCADPDTGSILQFDVSEYIYPQEATPGNSPDEQPAKTTGKPTKKSKKANKKSKTN
ncbi:MAG TPA: hypothetical protein VLC98_03475 [Phnomibacter sp.]|nr:hypothetical protein [Phnomibacter sp.]